MQRSRKLKETRKNTRGQKEDELSVVEEDVDNSWKMPIRTGTETNRQLGQWYLEELKWNNRAKGKYNQI